VLFRSYYYPFYPLTSWSYSTTCSQTCCTTFPTSYTDACCSYSYVDDYSSSSYWWVSLIVIGAFIIIVAIIVGCLNATKGKRQIVRPLVPSSFIQPVNSNIQPIYPNPNIQTIYPILPSNHNRLPSLRYNEPPPNYDAFMNQQATINVGQETSQTMPALPASVEMNNTINTDTNTLRF